MLDSFSKVPEFFIFFFSQNILIPKGLKISLLFQQVWQCKEICGKCVDFEKGRRNHNEGWLQTGLSCLV